jgi:transposase
MRKKGVTLTLLWEEYKQQYPDGLMLSQFCDRYRSFRKQNEVYMRKAYKAGERMLVDWAGQTMAYTDGQGETHKAYVFVAVLPSSSYLYVEAFRDMGQESWTLAHTHAFEYYGGAPRLLVPDNTKTAVVKASYYDPQLNNAYQEMARHYGAAIVPARSRAPTDKAPVETGVQIIERRIIAKLRDRRFLSFEELCRAVGEEREGVNTQAFQKLPGNRRQIFRETEQGELRALPASAYEYAHWKQVKVAFDYHVPFESYFYSVPSGYAGKRVDIRATSRMIEVFSQGERIALHIRAYDAKNRYVTCWEHMPEKHRAVADWSPERFRSWAAKTGEATAAYITYLLEQREHPEQAYKTCAGILRLGKTVPPERMEEACVTALAQHIYSYKYFSRLLADMDRQDSSPIAHGNIRGQEYYSSSLAFQALAEEAPHA